MGLFFGVRCLQSPGTAKCRIQDIHPSDVLQGKRHLLQNPHNLVDFLRIIPIM
jgi:hypothetical protein